MLWIRHGERTLFVSFLNMSGSTSNLSALITPASVQDLAQNLDQTDSSLTLLDQKKKTNLWLPNQVLFTPAALDTAWGQQIYQRMSELALLITKLKQNRVTGLRGKTKRETYGKAKQTMAVTVAPPRALKL